MAEENKKSELEVSVDADMKEAELLLADDKLYMADSKLKAILARLTNIIEDKAEAERQAPLATKLADTVKAHPIYDEVQRKVVETQALLGEFANDAGWDQVSNSDGVRVQYRIEPGKGTHSFKVSGDVRCEITKLIACLYEIDLFHNWFPMLKSSACLATPSRFRKIVQVVVSVPWPFANRETVCDCYGVNVMEDNKVVVFLKSADEKAGFAIPDPAGNVRILVHLGGFLIEPKTQHLCRLSMMANMDPQIPMVPYAMVNWFTSKLIHYIIPRLRKACNFDAKHPYAQRIQANPNVYDYIDRMAKQYYAEKEAAGLLKEESKLGAEDKSRRSVSKAESESSRSARDGDRDASASREAESKQESRASENDSKQQQGDDGGSSKAASKTDSKDADSSKSEQVAVADDSATTATQQLVDPVKV